MNRLEDQAAATVEQLIAVLREARELLWAISDRRTCEHLELLLTKAELLASELHDQPTAPSAPVEQAAVSEEEFSRVLSRLQASRFDDDKLTSLGDLGPTRRYTSAQVCMMLKVFTFDDNRADALRKLRSQITDPDNLFEVLDAFDSEFARQDARRILDLG